MKYFGTTLLLFLFINQAMAQDETVAKNEDEQDVHLKVSGFVDLFYVYDFNQPNTGFRQPFLFNHNRHNEVNLNLGFIKLAAETKRYRANLALQAGTYAQDNYAAEQGLLKNVFEGNAGFAIDKQSKWWLDAGIFSSHLGFENPQSNLNMTLTRSLMAESSPYYLCGAKLTFSPSEKWDFTALVVNGWQRIQRQKDNSAPGLGSQIQFKIKDKLTANWSTYVGSEFPDNQRRMRYFSDLWLHYTYNKHFSFIAGLDYGMEQAAKKSSVYFNWFAPLFIAQYKFNDRWAVAARYEQYDDPNNVIVSTLYANGFLTKGYSVNLDFSPSKNVKVRIEARGLTGKEYNFISPPNAYRDNFILASSIAISF